MDIISFFIIFGVIVAMFANALYILNIPRINLETNEALDDDLDLAPNVFFEKSRYPSAWFKIYDVSIGNADNEPYGDGNDRWILHLFYIISTFIMTITIFNMLVALMGDTHSALDERRQAVIRGE